MTKSILHFLTVSVVAISSLSAVAGGYSVEDTASGLGNAYAGASALAEDATTSYFNPAGMVVFDHPQISLDAMLINGNFDTSYTYAVANSLFLPGGAPPPIVGNDREDGGGWFFFPSAFFAWPMTIQNQRIAFGFSVYSPFGLGGNYTKSAMSRYLLTKERLLTIDLSPTIAWEPFPCFSIAAGFDAQYLDTRLQSQVNVGGGFPDGTFNHEGDDWGYGWNVGLLYRMPQWGTRVGLTYRSRINHLIKGDVSLFMPTLPVYGNLSRTGSLELRFPVPDHASLSLVQDINPCWSILGTAEWFHWSIVDTLTLKYSGDITAITPANSLAVNFKDSWRYEVAVNFRPNECWKLRAGVMYDETPVRNTYSRTFQIPGGDRIWVTAGANYKINNTFSVDAGLAHIFVKRVYISQAQFTPATGTVRVDAKLDNSYNSISLQLNMNLANL